MRIPIDVVGQNINCHKTMKFITGSSKFVKFAFKLDDDWKNLTIQAKFKQNGKEYNQSLDSNYIAYLPDGLSEGTCEMTLYGTGNGTVATTDVITIELIKNNLI